MSLLAVACTLFVCPWTGCTDVDRCGDLKRNYTLSAQEFLSQEAQLNFRFLAALQSRMERVHPTQILNFEARRDRLRMSSWLPDLRVRYSYSIDDDEGITTREHFPSENQSYSSHSRSGLDQKIDIQLSWRLSDLLVHPEELQHRRLAAQELDDRRELQRSLVEALNDFIRHTKALKMASSISARQRARQKMLMVMLHLDHLTAGAFSKLWAEEMAR